MLRWEFQKTPYDCVILCNRASTPPWSDVLIFYIRNHQGAQGRWYQWKKGGLLFIWRLVLLSEILVVDRFLFGGVFHLNSLFPFLFILRKLPHRLGSSGNRRMDPNVNLESFWETSHVWKRWKYMVRTRSEIVKSKMKMHMQANVKIIMMNDTSSWGRVLNYWRVPLVIRIVIFRPSNWNSISKSLKRNDGSDIFMKDSSPF